MSQKTGNQAGPKAPALALAALGIVYGDLGTSPLYTMQTVLQDSGGRAGPAAALGILSLIFWTLLITISVKYCVVVMRADNHGEGGILALLSLIEHGKGKPGRLLIFCGLFGAALIYGDGIITPAISVLSALEGINVATDALKPFIMPLAAMILLILFTAQKFGTAHIANLFGPIMLLWFVVIAIYGFFGILHHPSVLVAVSPGYAVDFLRAHGLSSLVVLGGVFLAVTGGEALYADMGHIGRMPIRASWFVIVLPALLLNYAGETALLFGPMTAGQKNPFFLLVPGWALYPTVALAVIATIIASQAIITGSFSLTRQAMQLGWLPGLHVIQTSDTEYGQIYVPFVNWVLMGFTLLLTVTFGSSARLAGAYGTAVSTTMLLTTVLLFVAMRQRWGWSKLQAVGVAGLFLIVDLAFFSANLLKIGAGGWIPLSFGTVIFICMITWHRGSDLLRRRMARLTEDAAPFLNHLAQGRIPRIDGTGIFMTRSSTAVAPLMARHVAQFGVLPSHAISLSIQFENRPRIVPAQRLQVEKIAEGIWHLTVHFGFIESPNLPAALAQAQHSGCPIDLENAIYFAGNDEVVRSVSRDRLGQWQRIMFGIMYRNAVHTVDRFSLPPEQVVEVGRQVEI